MKIATILRGNLGNSYEKAESVRVIQSGGSPPRTGNSHNIFSTAEKPQRMGVQVVFYVRSLLICKNAP